MSTSQFKFHYCWALASGLLVNMGCGQVLRRVVPAQEEVPLPGKLPPLLTIPSSIIKRLPGTVQFPTTSQSQVTPKRKLDVVRLIDGSIYEGQALALGPQGLQFKLAQGLTVAFRRWELSRLTMAELPTKDAPVAAPVEVLLRDGSVLPAQEFTLDQDQAKIKLTEGSLLECKRPAVAKVSMVLGVNTMYAQESEGWQTVPAGGWRYQDEAWHVAPTLERATLARTFDFPPRMVLEFTTNQTDFALRLFYYALEGGISTGTLNLSVHDNALSLMQYDGQGILYPARKQPLFFLTGETAIRHAIYYDSVEGRVVVTRNAMEVGTYEVSKIPMRLQSRRGNSLQFIGRPELTLRDLAVRPWLGGVPKPTAMGARQDLIDSGTAEAIVGDIAEITNRAISLADGRKVLRNQSLLVHLHSQHAAPSKLELIKLQLNGGGHLSVSNLKLANDTLTASSPLTGGFTCTRDLLRSVTFISPTPIAPPSLGALNPDTLTFQDRTQMRGTLLPSLNTEQVRWKISAVAEALEIPIAQVSSLQTGEPTLVPPRPDTVIAFRNGDWLPARLQAVAPEEITIEPQGQAVQKVKCADVMAIYHAPGASALTDAGPSLAWTTARRRYDAGARQYRYESEGAAPHCYFDGVHSFRQQRSDYLADGLQFSLPPCVSPLAIEFTLSAESHNVTLVGAEDVPLFNIFLSGSRLQVSRLVDPNDRGAFLGANRNERFVFDIKQDVRALMSGSSSKETRYQIVLDPINHRLHLGRNDLAIGTCQLSSKQPWREVKKLMWSSATTRLNQELAVQDLWIHPAPGQPASGADLRPSIAQPWIALNNGDCLKAQTYHFEDSAWTMETEALGELRVPTQRISAVVFDVAAPGPARAPAPCRVRWHQGGCLSGETVHLAPDGVHLSGWLGKYVIPIAALREVIFPKPSATK